MTVKTNTGKEFECDMTSEIDTPPRLYFHIKESTFGEVATAFSEEGALPVEGYPNFTVVQSISVTSDGVRVTLKIPGT